jgi:hypothetical protein
MKPMSPIPGFAEIDQWPIAPVPPITIMDFGCYRDPKPHPSVFVDLVDSVGKKYSLFFDSFLWRLCFGSNPDDENAALVTVGSPLEQSILEILDSAIASDKKFEILSEPVKYVKHLSPNYK